MENLYSLRTCLKMLLGDGMHFAHPPSGSAPGDTVSDLTGRGIELMAYRNDSDALNS